MSVRNVVLRLSMGGSMECGSLSCKVKLLAMGASRP